MRQIARWMPAGMVLLAAAAMLVHGPVHQFAHYHDFADSRAWLGIPNAGDVISNAAFAVVGLWGLWALRDKRQHPMLAASWAGYCLFLWAVVLTAFGSSFYHLAPDNGRLLWDRLPIALACAGILAAVHAQTHRPPQSLLVPLGLAIAGVASVAWWSVTDRMGAGDLRPYLLMQGAALVLIPLWQAFHGSARADRIAFGVAILLYVAAKVAELNDGAILEALHFMSGHTLKHLLAAAASAVITANLVHRVRPGRGASCSA